MTLTLELPPEVEARLAARARAAGVDLATYLTRHVTQELTEVAKPTLADWEELVRPVAEAFEASGMTDEELTELLEREKHAMRAEKRARDAT